MCTQSVKQIDFYLLLGGGVDTILARNPHVDSHVDILAGKGMECEVLIGGLENPPVNAACY